jgi:hypothetical protein
VSAQAKSIALLIAGLLFVVFLIVKLVAPERRRGPNAHAARRRIAEAKRRASDRALSSAQRAAALREAALVALQELDRPNLAASYARRADRLDPEDPGTLALLSTALRAAARFRALERLLWRRVADAEPFGEAAERAVQELLSLYEGPLNRPEVARALRRLRAAA